MSVTDTESTMRDYMNALLGGGDFAAFFSDDVLWTTMETGDEIRGRDAVRDYIVALHSELFEAAPELRSLAVADGIASPGSGLRGQARRRAGRRTRDRRPGAAALRDVLRRRGRQHHRAACVLPDHRARPEAAGRGPVRHSTQSSSSPTTRRPPSSLST